MALTAEQSVPVAEHTQQTHKQPVQSSAPAAVLKTDLSISGLWKSFDNNVSVLQDINLTVTNGQAVALIGHNGSGKSTLLRCCLRLIEPSRGEIQLLGNNITGARTEALRQIRSKAGFIFQKHNLVPRLSVLTNVLHGAQARRRGPRVWYQSLAIQWDREEAMECLNRVGLAHLSERRADQLSGGESQRVAIARALMQRPKLMMADEPVASLDPSAGEEVMELFLNLIGDEGITLIFVSHNLEHALKYSDRIIGLRSGRIDLNTASNKENAASLRGLYD
jgi:phosphonate transport system ATP-binding protein